MKFPHELFVIAILILLIMFHVVDYFYKVFILKKKKLPSWLWSIWRLIPFIVLTLIWYLLEQWIC